MSGESSEKPRALAQRRQACGLTRPRTLGTNRPPTGLIVALVCHAALFSACTGHTSTLLFDPPPVILNLAEPPAASPLQQQPTGETKPITAALLERFRSAIEMDDIYRLEKTIAEGVHVNRVLSDGNTPLIFAMQSGSTQVVDWYLRHPRLQVNQKNSMNETALMTAAALGESEWVNRLLARGGEINRPAGQWTALHYAAANGRLSVVQQLCARNGTVIDALSPNGTTPLMMAARANSMDIVRFLLGKGARTDLENQAGLSALTYAKRNANPEMEQLIKQFGLKSVD